MTSKQHYRIILVTILMLLLVACTETNANETNTSETNDLIEAPTPRTITDMAGRQVEIPDEITKVYGVNNNATYILYTLVPDKIIGWNVKLSEESKVYILDAYRDLPVLGALYGNATKASPEEILAHNPQLIVMSDRVATKKCISAAEELQNTLEIPVIVIENSLSSYDDAYSLLGEVFDEEERAAELSAYYLDSYEFAEQHAPDQADQVNVYYARSDNGLGTDFSGSYHTELLDLIGAKNVAIDTSDTENSQSGKVTNEQVIQWNPDYIIVGQMGAEESNIRDVLLEDERWSNIKAVTEGQVYSIPNKPFNWFDRPPSVNRIIGIKYLGHLLYPEIYTEDPAENIKDFFALFYQYELSDEQAAEFLRP